MGMLVISLVVGVLAVTRVTKLLVDDRIMLWFRTWVIRRWGEGSLPAELVYCPWCISMWVSVPIMLTAGLYPNKWVIAALSVLAASLVASIIASKIIDQE